MEGFSGREIGTKKMGPARDPSGGEKGRLGGFDLESAEWDEHAMSMRRRREMIGKLGWGFLPRVFIRLGWIGARRDLTASEGSREIEARWST